MSDIEYEDYEPHKLLALERYFNDLYKYMIYQLAHFDSAPRASMDDKKRLKELLQELIYVKTLLEDGL